jgi:hypothetical protein
VFSVMKHVYRLLVGRHLCVMRHSASVVLAGTVYQDFKSMSWANYKWHSAEGIMNDAPTSMLLKLIWEEFVSDVKK